MQGENGREKLRAANSKLQNSWRFGGGTCVEFEEGEMLGDEGAQQGCDARAMPPKLPFFCAWRSVVILGGL